MVRFAEEEREHLNRQFFDDWVVVAYEEATHYMRWLGRLKAKVPCYPTAL